MEIGEIENKERIDLKSQNGTTSIINKIMNQKTIPVFNKYSAYKDSGVEWLGEIPEHWDLLSNKNIFKLNKNQVGKKSNEYVLLSLTLKGVIKRIIDDGGKFPAEFDTYQKVEKGDFIFCLFDVEETPRCVGLSDIEGMITGAYSVMKVNSKFNKTFLYYFYLCLDTDKRMKPLYTGLRNTISKDNFFAFKTFVPPLQEQNAIATFLDNKTAKIDYAIAQKEKMIALLKERKQIIIQDLVTGKKVWNETLNTWTEPTELKDSGVKWIGEIPAHWEVKRLKYVFKVYKEKVSGLDSDLPFVGMENIESKSGKYIHTISEVEGLSNRFKKGDILFGKLRPYLAKVYLAEFNGICSTEFIVFENANSRYFSKLLLSDTFIQVVDGSTYGAKMPRASLEFIRNIEIPIPAVKEQNAIVSHIESQSTKIDKAITLQEQQIEKLKELKSTLIDSAVTGKIKV